MPGHQLFAIADGDDLAALDPLDRSRVGVGDLLGELAQEPRPTAAHAPNGYVGQLRPKRNGVEHIGAAGADQVKRFTAAIQSKAKIVLGKHHVSALSESGAGRKDVLKGIAQIIGQAHARETDGTAAVIVELDHVRSRVIAREHFVQLHRRSDCIHHPCSRDGRADLPDRVARTALNVNSVRAAVWQTAQRDRSADGNSRVPWAVIQAPLIDGHRGPADRDRGCGSPRRRARLARNHCRGIIHYHRHMTVEGILDRRAPAIHVVFHGVGVTSYGWEIRRYGIDDEIKLSLGEDRVHEILQGAIINRLNLRMVQEEIHGAP